MADGIVIIAEAGVNHNGDLSLAKELVSAAAAAGADIVKFQSFKAENLVTQSAEKAEYQKENCGADESQYEMLKRLELTQAMHFEILECCKQNDIEFLSTAFDSDSLNFLTTKIGLKTLKLPSGEITNGPLIHAHAITGLDIIVSTGMSALHEVEAALAVLAHGYCKPTDRIEAIEDCYEILKTCEGQAALKKHVTLLHCTSNYPAQPQSVNLRAMDTLAEAFALPVGYSDHTMGIIASVAAAARGACVIEKHLTLDRAMKGPDHKASLEPDELIEMVEAIRSVEVMLGSGVKEPDISEANTKTVARKSIYAQSDIQICELFGPNNMTLMRPETGISPMKWWTKLSTKATKHYKKGDLIE